MTNRLAFIFLSKYHTLENIQGSITPTHSSIPDELTDIMNSTAIDYERISEGFGISLDGIETIIERLHQSLPSLLITNGHILAILMSELAMKATTHDAGIVSPEASSMEQKIDQIAQSYYRGYIWELFESLVFCLKMVEIAYTN